MAYDLETARVRIGLNEGDTTKDGMLTIAMNASLGEAQKYCNRQFFFVHEKVEFIHFAANMATLSRYPVRRIFSIDLDGNRLSDTQYHTHHSEGKIIFDNRQVAHSMVVDYEGGYVQLPSELELALWMMFDIFWASVSATTGAQSLGEIKSISVPDVGKIDYGTSSSTSSTSSSGEFPPALARSILDLFRMIVC